MPDRSDFPLPISPDSAHAHISAWPAVEAEPVNLISIMPGDSLPARDAVVAALSKAAGEEFTIVDEPAPMASAAWNVLIAGPALPAPLVVWAEPMRPLPDETVKFLKCEACRWAVGVETVLEPDEPHEHLQQIIRILGRALPHSPAILNVNTGGWHTRQELEETLMPAEMPAGPALTYMVHAIGPEQKDDADPPRLWAYTDGLRTSGRIELEMHGIAPEDGRFATFLLNNIAEMVADSGLPEPGEAIEIGGGVFVRFMPWQDAARDVPQDWLGSMTNREDHAERKLEGARAAVCALDSLRWPEEAARAAARGEFALYKTLQATQREAKIARHTLDRFAHLFRCVPAPRRKASPEQVAAFMVKAGFAVAKHAVDEDDREHLWFEVVEIQNGRVRGTLLHEPSNVRLRAGDETWIDRNVISDWQIFTPRGQFGPTQHRAARETLAELLATPTPQGDQP